ncbi:replication initiation protein [Achromobacter sp. AGC78]
MSAALLARIEASAPRRPWCGPEKDRCRVRPLATALTEPYIQLNPPAHVYWLQFDIDKGEASHTWADCNLPPPTYVAVNPSNGHAHYGYALASPVCKTDAGRQKPLAYLAAIEYAYNRKLEADRAFRGPLAKNPLHANWHLWQPANDVQYELSELAEHVELPRLEEMRADRINPDYAALGRNCWLFEGLRQQAYLRVKAFWRPAGDELFYEWLLLEAKSLNQTFPVPLGFGEVKSIARSVTRWVWKRFTPSGFRAIQAARGRASGVARRFATQELRQRAAMLTASGLTSRQVAGQLEVNQSTVVRWLRAKGSGEA